MYVKNKINRIAGERRNVKHTKATWRFGKLFL